MFDLFVWKLSKRKEEKSREKERGRALDKKILIRGCRAENIFTSIIQIENGKVAISA